MKARDLNVGNWVFDGEHNERELPITSSMLRWALDREDNIPWQPIPLTEEWLLKFGFHYRNELRGPGCLLDLDHKDWKKSFCVAKLSNPDYKGYCALATGRQDIVYVHQLQNLYYALTGTELEIKQ